MKEKIIFKYMYQSDFATTKTMCMYQHIAMARLEVIRELKLKLLHRKSLNLFIYNYPYKSADWSFQMWIKCDTLIYHIRMSSHLDFFLGYRSRSDCQKFFFWACVWFYPSLYYRALSDYLHLFIAARVPSVFLQICGLIDRLVISPPV